MLVIKVPKQTCNYCTKLTDELLIFSGNVRFCPKCWEKHLQTQRMLANQEWIDECQECQTPINTLMQEARSTQISMTIVAKDGIYQYLCKRCASKYLTKRKDLFEGTAAEKLYA